MFDFDKIFSDNDKSIAIVANGGSITDRKLGKAIDSHHFVVRFNNFNISDEHKEYTGQKVNIWSNTFHFDIIDRPINIPILCPVPINRPPYNRIYGIEHDLMNKNLSKTKFIPVEIFEELCGLMPIHPVKRRKDPSSGLSIIFWLKKIGFNISHENLFGFDFFFHKNHHYFSDSKGPSINHQGDIEKMILDKILI